MVAVVATLWSLRTDDSEPSSTITPGPAATPSVNPAPTTASPAQPASIEVEILNASAKAGLAAKTAQRAKKAGWTVAVVGNWKYGASHEAVYYPDGHQGAAQRLAADLGIAAVEPATSGMKPDRLTVLVLD